MRSFQAFLALVCLSALFTGAAFALSQNDIGDAQMAISNINSDIRGAQQYLEYLNSEIDFCNNNPGDCDQAYKDEMARQASDQQKAIDDMEDRKQAAEDNLKNLQDAFAAQKAGQTDQPADNQDGQQAGQQDDQGSGDADTGQGGPSNQDASQDDQNANQGHDGDNAPADQDSGAPQAN